MRIVLDPVCAPVLLSVACDLRQRLPRCRLKELDGDCYLAVFRMVLKAHRLAVNWPPHQVIGLDVLSWLFFIRECRLDYLPEQLAGEGL